MWSGDTAHATYSPPRRRARDHLRTRGVLRDAYLSDLAYSKALTARAHDRRLDLAPDQRDVYPMLQAHLETHDGYPPPVTRKHHARLRHLNGMYDAYGPLVMLRLSLPALDAYPLYSKDMSTRSRAAVLSVMRDLSGKHTVYTSDVQRGEQGQLQAGTHAHPVTPLILLPDDYRDRLQAAPHGSGGGTELPRHAAHGVVILPTADDREAVARYVTRHPDGRLDNPNSPVYLQALEDELRRLAQKNQPVKLGWSKNVLPLLST